MSVRGVMYLAGLELHGRAEANCREQGTVGFIVYWIKAVASPISDKVLQVFLVFLFLTLLCVSSRTRMFRHPSRYTWPEICAVIKNTEQRAE